MRIGSFEIKYISHVCFIFETPAGKSIITDPFFGKGFEHDGHYEKYLSPPQIKITDIKKCDIIFRCNGR
jgi:L-ascorbate metabolism protein UlaG (beta-lactamase superfamily)